MRTFATFLMLVFACSGCEKDCEPTHYVVREADTLRVADNSEDFVAPYEVCGGEVRRIDENEGFGFFINDTTNCERDSDCPSGACVYHAIVGFETTQSFSFRPYFSECLPATCRSGADCERGICRAGFNGCNRVVSFGCATENDTCEEVDDCGWPNQGGCQPGEGGFQCRGQDCPIDE